MGNQCDETSVQPDAPMVNFSEMSGDHNGLANFDLINTYDDKLNFFSEMALEVKNIFNTVKNRVLSKIQTG